VVLKDDLRRHNQEIQHSREAFEARPLLRVVYRDLHATIRSFIDRDLPGMIVEIGSGNGSLRTAIPEVILTDLFPNPWIDRVEDVYNLSFADGSISHLVMFDVFHHLEYPGSALREFNRVLVSGGKVIMIEPSIGLLGLLVYGLFHHEPLGLFRKIKWEIPSDSPAKPSAYFAAQGNPGRIFFGRKFKARVSPLEVVCRRRFSALSYIASGGYSGMQLYPASLYRMMKRLEWLIDWLPQVFATRMIVVLKKS
jgi:SAM-dependent methyltransferase